MCRKKEFVTEKDFRQFAERVKHSGLSTKQALDKFVKAMMQGPKLKMVRKKQPVRKTVGGVLYYPDGREVCKTKAAWQGRREEVWQRDLGMCQRQIEPGAPFICGISLHLHEAHIHHIRKRSLDRNDAVSNLMTLCQNCHSEIHDEFKKRGQP